MADRAQFDALTDSLEDRAAALAQAIAGEVGSLWTPAVIEASQRAVDAAVARDDGGAVANIVTDAADVRRAIVEPVNARLVHVHDTIQGAVIAAVIEGYTDALFGRAEIHNRDGGDVVEVEVTDSDMQQLAQWPIFGHPAPAWVARMVAAARWEFESLVMQPVVGQSPSTAIPERAAQASSAFVDAVRSSVVQAYLSGTQAASEEWRQYLAGLQ